MFPRLTGAMGVAHFTTRALNKSLRFVALTSVLVLTTVTVNALIIVLDGSRF